MEEVLLEEASPHYYGGSLALPLLLAPALPSLAAAFRQDSGVAYTQYCTVLYCTVLYRQDSGVAYSDYGAAFARFVETQHRRLYTTQAAAWLDHPQLADIRQVPRLPQSEDALTL